MTLVEAREAARADRAKFDQGDDPIAVRLAACSSAGAEQNAQQSFRSVAALYVAHHAKAWNNAKLAAQWASALRTYAQYVIASLRVRDVTTAHVRKVLKPIWTAKTEQRGASGPDGAGD